jgi:hypothetical protein
MTPAKPTTMHVVSSCSRRRHLSNAYLRVKNGLVVAAWYIFRCSSTQTGCAEPNCASPTPSASMCVVPPGSCRRRLPNEHWRVSYGALVGTLHQCECHNMRVNVVWCRRCLPPRLGCHHVGIDDIVRTHTCARLTAPPLLCYTYVIVVAPTNIHTACAEPDCATPTTSSVKCVVPLESCRRQLSDEPLWVSSGVAVDELQYWLVYSQSVRGTTVCRRRH